MLCLTSQIILHEHQTRCGTHGASQRLTLSLRLTCYVISILCFKLLVKLCVCQCLIKNYCKLLYCTVGHFS